MIFHHSSRVLSPVIYRLKVVSRVVWIFVVGQAATQSTLTAQVPDPCPPPGPILSGSEFFGVRIGENYANSSPEKHRFLVGAEIGMFTTDSLALHFLWDRIDGGRGYNDLSFGTLIDLAPTQTGLNPFLDVGIGSQRRSLGGYGSGLAFLAAGAEYRLKTVPLGLKAELRGQYNFRNTLDQSTSIVHFVVQASLGLVLHWHEPVQSPIEMLPNPKEVSQAVATLCCLPPVPMPEKREISSSSKDVFDLTFPQGSTALSEESVRILDTIHGLLTNGATAFIAGFPDEVDLATLPKIRTKCEKGQDAYCLARNRAEEVVKALIKRGADRTALDYEANTSDPKSLSKVIITVKHSS